jgi:protein O-GlcNAc transferase
MADIDNELGHAAALLGQGRHLEAEQALQQVLARDPGSFDALHLLGVIAAQTGRAERAVELISRALGQDDTVAAAHCHLGLALATLGRRDAAVVSLRRALELNPQMASAWLNLSALLVDQQRFDEALACAGRAAELQPGSLAAMLNRAAALRGLGRLPEALAAYDQVLALQPDNATAWLSRGDVLLALEFADQALASYEGALALAPQSAAAAGGCGVALLALRRPQQALEAFQRALQASASSSASPARLHANCASAYLALNRPEEALASALRAVELEADLFEGQHNRAAALLALHQLRPALEAYDRAVSLSPKSAAAHCGRGDACREMGDRPGAVASYRRAIAIEPEHAAARLGVLLSTVPVVAGSAHEVDESRLELAAELARFDEWQSTQTRLDAAMIVARAQPFYLAYQERSNKELLMRWGSLCTRLMERWASHELAHAVQPDPPPDGPMRLGIVTAHACQHSVYLALLKGWLGRLDAGRLRISVFHVGKPQDAVGYAAGVAGAQAELIDCSRHSLRECIDAIRERRSEVLLYPEIGMDPVTFALANLRLARHQIASWGHPETTGLPTIDYFLSSEAFEPPHAEDSYSEQLIRLPGIGCYYEPLEVAGSASLERHGLSPERPLLISAGTPYKYAPERDRVFVAIARELPECQIVFFGASQTLTAKVQARIQSAFRDAGRDPGQHLRVLPWLSQQEFFSLLRRADVYLDTLGFSGFNTVMQAIECALPIVAYEGRFMRGRFASGLMRRMGLDELVVTSESEYLRRVVRLIEDRSFSDAVRRRLDRERHGLYRDRAAVDALSAFIASLPR